jgi:hypothetical protein
MSRYTFTVPKGYTREMVAEILTAYLLDHRAFDNKRPAPDQPRWRGPFRKESSVDDNRWQLDDGNDYFLQFKGDQATFSHRYDNEEKCEAILALFKVMHPLSKKQLAAQPA